MKRRHFMLLLGGASSGALGLGSGAFSSVEAERGVAVNVVEDEEAYLSLEQVKTEIPADHEEEVVKVGNQFADDLNLTVTVEESTNGIEYVSVEDDGDIEDLTPGHSVSVSVECIEDGSFTLGFDGTAGGASVDTTRTFEIECDRVKFEGENGAVKVYGNSADLTITKELDDGSTKTETINPNPSGKAVTNSGNNTIESVTVNGTTYSR